MARRVLTPASRARSSMASRSSANCGKSMCAWESMRSMSREPGFPEPPGQDLSRPYFSLAPTSTSSGKPARTGRPSGPTEAAMIMPFGSTQFFVCHGFDPLDRFRFFDTRKKGLCFAELYSANKLPPPYTSQFDGGNGTWLAEQHPHFRGAFWKNWMRECADDT